MSKWGEYGYYGITWGLMLCAITVPLLALAQKAFRARLRIYWLLVCAAVTLYLTGIFAFTMMPLSTAADVLCSTKGAQLIPFASFASAAKATSQLPLLAKLTNFSVLQLIFNVIMFIPWGFMARAIFKRKVGVAAATAFGASLLIETTQLTGFWGYYHCAYRIFDVDDLITNTLGGLLGALLAALWVRLRRRPENPLRTPKLFSHLPSLADQNQIGAQGMRNTKKSVG